MGGATNAYRQNVQRVKDEMDAEAKRREDAKPKGTAVGGFLQHKTVTEAGGLRDITREAVRSETGGSGLEKFFPDYLK
jgi:hypothetical protein